MTEYTAVLAFASVGMLALVVLGLLRREVPGATFFVVLCAGGFCYTFGSLFEIRSETATEMLGWLTLEYVGISLFGPCWLNAAFRVAGWAPRGRLLVLLSFLPALPTVLLVATNDAHHWFYAAFALERHGAFSVALIERGPWYLIQYAYFVLCSLVGLVVLLRWGLRTSALRRNQAFFLIGGLLAPWLANLVYQFGWSPLGLDTAPLGISLSCLLLGIALFRYKLFDLAPLAYESVFHGSADAIAVFDGGGRLLAVNRTWSAVFADTVAAEGSAGAQVLGPWPALSGFLLPGAPPTEFTKGEGIWEASATALADRSGRRRGTIVTLHDVTARIHLQRSLERQATTDGLTGVANRRHFFELAERELSRARRVGQPLALAMVDLDHFKAVNDTHGHATGDAVLASVARSCSSSLRSVDVLGRYGGEEFAIVMPHTDLAGGRLTAERLRAAVEGLTIDSPAGTLRVTLSVGLAVFSPASDATLTTLLASADTALYRAKAEGRNRVESSS